MGVRLLRRGLDAIGRHARTSPTRSDIRGWNRDILTYRRAARRSGRPESGAEADDPGCAGAGREPTRRAKTPRPALRPRGVDRSFASLAPRPIAEEAATPWRSLISCGGGSGSASGASCDQPCGGPFHGGDWPYVLLGWRSVKRSTLSPSLTLGVKARRRHAGHGPATRESPEFTRSRRSAQGQGSVEVAIPVDARSQTPDNRGQGGDCRSLATISWILSGLRKTHSTPSCSDSSGSTSHPVIRAIRGLGTSRRAACTTSRPSKSGKRTSVRTKSNSPGPRSCL